MGGLLICMLIGMVTTGLGLMCMQCSNNLNTRCTGELKNCSQDQVCVSTLMQTIYIGSQTTHTFERDCGAESQCNASSSISSLISISSRSGCCRTDNCTVDIPSFSNVTKPVNSVQCPVCLTHDRSCFTSKLTNCTGDEKYCASFEMYTGNSAKTYIAGCASKSFCKGDRDEGDGFKTCIRSANSRLAYPSLVILLMASWPVHCLI